MPSIDLIVNELVVRGRPIGRLEVDAHNDVENGVPVWQLDKLELVEPRRDARRDRELAHARLNRERHRRRHRPGTDTGDGTRRAAPRSISSST